MFFPKALLEKKTCNRVLLQLTYGINVFYFEYFELSFFSMRPSELNYFCVYTAAKSQNFKISLMVYMQHCHVIDDIRLLSLSITHGVVVVSPCSVRLFCLDLIVVSFYTRIEKKRKK